MRYMILAILFLLAGCSAEQLNMGLGMASVASESYLVMKAEGMTPDERMELAGKLIRYADTADTVSENLRDAAARIQPPEPETDP